MTMHSTHDPIVIDILPFLQLHISPQYPSQDAIENIQTPTLGQWGRYYNLVVERPILEGYRSVSIACTSPIRIAVKPVRALAADVEPRWKCVPAGCR